MRRHRAVMIVAGVVAVWCAAPLPVTAAPAVAQVGTWGTAIEVPGLESLNQSGLAQLNSVSCGAAGNCVAGGSYGDGSGHGQAFVASEKNGTWRKAIEVPGVGILNVGGFATVYSVSCATAGNCAAVGIYTDVSGHGQAFVVSETNGTWGTAIKVPGTARLNKFGTSINHDFVSCASPGNCAAVGGYEDGASHFQVFVASQTNGTWSKAIKMPFLGILNWGGSAQVSSVSCATAGNCAAAGSYRDRSGHAQAFVVSLTNGVWDTAIEVPGSAALNVGRDASADSVSCVSAGNCTAVGDYSDGVGSPQGRPQPFAVRETNGTWGEAIKMPGHGLFDADAGANVIAVSCAKAGNCAAGGTYDDAVLSQQAFVANEKSGTWRHAIEVPGSGTLNTARFAVVKSVSCPSAGNCAAGGFYMAGSPAHEEAFVVNEANGTWGNAIEAPGSVTLNAGDAAVTSVSCHSGRCAAGGTYVDGSGRAQAFVVNQG